MNYFKNKNIYNYRRLNNNIFTFNYNNEDLNKYYNIRKNIFEKVWNVKYICDEYDNKDNIIIIKENNKVTGGISTIISTFSNGILLPGEKLYNYNYKSVLSNINYNKNVRYGELARFFVIPNKRNTDINKMLFSKALEKFDDNKCEYIFGVCPENLVMYYKYMFISNGYTFDLTNNKKYINNKIKYSYLSISKKIK